MELGSPLIVDLGTSSIKVGLNNEEKPRLHFPNYIGELYEVGEDSAYKKIIGSDCDSQLEKLVLKYPIQNGIFHNREDIKIVFDYLFEKMGLSSERTSHPLLISEPLFNDKSNKANISEYLFEELDVPALSFASQPILSLFGTSKTTGTILESGDGITQSCIVFEGYSIPNSYIRYDYGGANITENLQFLLSQKGYSFYGPSGLQIVKKIKEQFCCTFCFKPKEDENDNNNDKDIFRLPDGSDIRIAQEKSLCSEFLFDPSSKGLDFKSMQKMIVESITTAGVDLRMKLYGTILLSGGNTALKGMAQSLHKEIKKISPEHVKVRLYKISQPEYGCWSGGKAVTSLETFKNLWVTKSEWGENGEGILSSKSI